MEDFMSTVTDVNNCKTVSWTELQGTVQPALYEVGLCERCDLPLSRYNPYTLCNVCRKALRLAALQKEGGKWLIRNLATRRVHWRKNIISFSRREPLEQP